MNSGVLPGPLSSGLGTLTIVPLGAGDIGDAAALHASCFSSPWSEESFRNELSLRHSFLLGVRHPETGDLLACVCYWIVADELHLLNIVTASQSRRMGVGHALLSRVIQEALRAGCRRMNLEVRPSNEAALALYHRHGFERIAVRRKYYQDNQEDAWVMERAIPRMS